MKTKKIVLGFQHLLAMFGATVLVPILTGLNPSLALLSAGIGTLIFHLTTKLKVPVFLGSSFAFIGAISIINKSQGIAVVKGGIIFAGLVYILLSLITYKVGVEKIQQFFPKIVVGPIIIVIGLRLAPVAINMATLDSNGHYSLPIIIISLSVLITMIIISILEKGFFKLVPIIVSIFIGFIVALILQSLNLYHIPNLTVLKEAGWLGLPKDAMKHLLTLPKFTASGIVAIAPIALVVFVEHIGDITTNGKNLIEKAKNAIYTGVGQEISEKGTGLWLVNGITSFYQNHQDTKDIEYKFDSISNGVIQRNVQKVFELVNAVA